MFLPLYLSLDIGLEPLLVYLCFNIRAQSCRWYWSVLSERDVKKLRRMTGSELFNLIVATDLSSSVSIV